MARHSQALQLHHVQATLRHEEAAVQSSLDVMNGTMHALHRLDEEMEALVIMQREQLDRVEEWTRSLVWRLMQVVGVTGVQSSLNLARSVTAVTALLSSFGAAVAGGGVNVQTARARMQTVTEEEVDAFLHRVAVIASTLQEHYERVKSPRGALAEARQFRQDVSDIRYVEDGVYGT